MLNLQLSTGRFTQQDTWLGNNQEPTTLNKYLYGNASPANYIDPTGHMSLASFGTATNIRSTLSTVSVPQFSNMISKAVTLSVRVSGKIIRKDLKKVRACIRNANKCGMKFNLLVVGYDNPSVLKFIRDNQMLRPMNLMLTYNPRPDRPRRWYVGKGGCRKDSARYSPDKDCDEFPFYRTKEGGAKNFPFRVSLDWMPNSENRSVGGHLGYLSRYMRGRNRGDDRFVVATSQDLPSFALPMGGR